MFERLMTILELTGQRQVGVAAKRKRRNGIEPITARLLTPRFTASKPFVLLSLTHSKKTHIQRGTAA